jgi:hypothetical protein
MPDPTPFEVRLADAYERYVAAAPVPTDPASVAAAARPSALTRGADRTRVVLPAVATIALVSLAVGAALVGARLDEATRVPTPTTLQTSVPATSAAPLPTAAVAATPVAAIAGYDPSFDGTYQNVFQPAGWMLHMAGNDVTPIAVTLADGRVLIAGGGDGGYPEQLGAQVWDPGTGESIPIDTGVNGGGSGILLGDGRVLIIASERNHVATRAAVFDPATMTFEQLPQPGSSTASHFAASPSVARLLDGRVLVAGGQVDAYTANSVASALLFDPATDTFTPTGPMRATRKDHAMITLPDGRVLVAGGYRVSKSARSGGRAGSAGDAPDAELYDPTTGTFSPLATTLDIGGATAAVPVAEGRLIALFPTAGDRIAVFDPATSTFVTDPAALAGLPGALPGTPASATPLRDGDILFTGSGWATVWVPGTGMLEAEPAPNELAAVAPLHDGRVLFASGWPTPASDGGDRSARIVVFR